MTQRRTDQASHGLGLVHRLTLERFANPAQSPVNGGANADLRQVSDQAVHRTGGFQGAGGVFHEDLLLDMADDINTRNRKAQLQYALPLVFPSENGCRIVRVASRALF